MTIDPNDLNAGIQIGGAIADLIAKLAGLAVESAGASPALHASIVQRFNDELVAGAATVNALVPGFAANDKAADDALRGRFPAPAASPTASVDPAAADRLRKADEIANTLAPDTEAPGHPTGTPAPIDSLK